MSLKAFVLKNILQHPPQPPSPATTVILSAAKNPEALPMRLDIFTDLSLVKLDSSPSSE